MRRKGVRIPERGDIAWISLDPVRGHEQAGRRPVIVLSPREFNRTCGLAIVVPMTSKHKGYTNEVPVVTQRISGTALTAHTRSVDWKARQIEFIESCPALELREIQAICAMYVVGDA